MAIKRWWLIGVILLLAAGALPAQEATGTISGVITDSTGAAIPGAAVEVQNTQTNFTRRTETDARGEYNVPALQPGLYNVSVTRDGFKKAVYSNVRLEVNQVVTVNGTLEIGTVTESVTVEVAATLVQSETTTVGQVVETRKIEELPLNGRQFLQLTTLVPGTISGYTRDASRQGGRRSLLNIAVSGGRTEFNNYVLDGVLNTDENFGTYVVSPSVDALQEFKVQTSSYSAQYGRGGAGQINIITKSGTNQLHGTAFEFLRNSDFDAKNFFDRSDRPIPPFKQNQFGATAGAPVYLPKVYNGRDKTFFFFDYEGFRIRQALTQVSTVATPEQRAGDFSKSGVTIYDPKTLQPDPSKAGGFVRSPFPNNAVPQNRMDPTSQYLLQFLPTPNLPGTSNNYLSNEGLSTNDDQFTGRLDHKIGPNDNIFGRYTLSDESTFNPGVFPGIGTFVNVRGQLLAVGETHVFGPRTVNEFRFGFNRLSNALLQQNAFKLDAVGQAGIVGLARNPIDFGIPAVSVQGITSWGDQTFGYPSLLRDNVYQYIDNLSLTRGRHNLNVGVEIRRFQYANFADNLPRGSYSFASPLFTSNPASPSGTGAGMADFLLGVPHSAEGSVGDTSIYDFRNSWNAYVQDDLRVSRKLTVNLGLRYEYNPYPYEKYDRIETLDLTTNPPTIVRAGSGDPYFFYPRNVNLNGIPYVRDGRFGRSLLQADKRNFAPRVGFAYSLNPKTVIRSAYGIFYTQDIGNPFFDLARNVPRNVRAALTSDPNTPQLDMKNLFSGLAGNQSVLVPALTMTDPHYPTGYVQQWTFNVQREIARDLVVEVGYVANKGTHLGILNLLNTAPPGPGAAQPRRPYPIYERIFFIQHILNSTYESLQARVEKKYSHGLSFLGSYTFGKSLDYASSTRTSGETNRPIDPTNLKIDHGRSLFDARQNFVFNTLYELPFGPGKRFANGGGLRGRLVGGWQISGIFQARTGLPFTVSASGDPANTGNDSSGRAQLLPGKNPVLPASQRTPDQWFNTSAYAPPAPYTFGNAGRNTLDGPGLVNFDVSMIKNISITEGRMVQFRSEFFNLMNTPHFGLNSQGSVQAPNRSVNGSGFGRISAAGPARQIQLALKFIF